MNKLIELWKYKLLIVCIVILFFSVPVIGNWNQINKIVVLLIYVIMPSLLWIFITYSLIQYGNYIKKSNIENEKTKS